MKRYGPGLRWARGLAPWALVLLITACGSAPVFNQIPEGDYRERIQTQETDRIRVSAAVPSARESEDLFGRRLYREGIQPVWLEIENNAETSVTFLPVGLDPEYYSPLEVASLGSGKPPSAENLVDRFFIDQSIDLMIDPGEKLSGFVFTKLDEGTKAFNVDISGRDAETGRPTFDTFTFFIPVPGLNIDHYSVDWANLYAEDQWVEADADSLIEEIEKYACCVTDKSGNNTGDPLNLILIGMPRDIYTAFIRAGWDETEAITGASTWKTVRSFFSGGEYRYSPISSLYVFGRPQDVAFQKARENIHERNHLRLWMSRATYQGLPVWIGQISRDIGVRFTRKTITTHKIDPDVDETREYLLENLAYAQSLKAFGYVGGVGEVSPDNPRGNLTGDPWFTDGYRLVLWVSSKPLPISELHFMHWRMPPFSKEPGQ
jgi:hypothetical protein